MDKILAAAISAQDKFAKLNLYRTFNNLGGTLRYFWYRNRLAMANKVISRLAMLIELFLIQNIFSRSTAVSFAFVYFLYISFGSLQKGISQVFRLRLVEGELTSDAAASQSASQSREYSKLLWYSGFYTLIAGCAVCLVCSLLGLSSFTILFSLLMLPVACLESLASAAWTAVYVRSRQNRNFYLTTGVLFIPGISLILLSSSLGILSYLLGYLLSRLALNIYLFVKARASLNLSGIRFQWNFLRSSQASISEILRHWPHLVFRVPASLYQIILFFTLYLYRKDLVLVHFMYMALSHMLFYPVTRAAQTFRMDYYLYLKKASFIQADKIRRRSEQLGKTVAAFVSFIVCLVAGVVSVYLGIVKSMEYALLPYLVLSLVVNSLLEIRLASLLTAGSERKCLSPLFAVYCLIAAPLQVFLLLDQRVNLQAVYCTEIFLTGCLLPFIYRKQLLKNSIFADLRLKSLVQEKEIPFQSLPDCFRAKESILNLPQCLVLLNERYDTVRKQKVLLDSICPEISTNYFKVKILPRMYLLIFPELEKRISLVELVQEKYSYHIRAVSSQLQNIEHAAAQISKNTHVSILPRELNILLQAFGSLHRGAVRKFVDENLRTIKDIGSDIASLAKLAKTLVQKYSLEDLIIAENQKGSLKLTRGNIQILNRALSDFSLTSERNCNLINPLGGKLVQFEYFGHTLLLLDASNAAERFELLKTLSLLWSVFTQMTVLGEKPAGKQTYGLVDYRHLGLAFRGNLSESVEERA